MRRRVGTIAAGMALLLGGATAGLVVGTSTAAAAEPVVIGSCSTTVSGAPGTPISLAPSAVAKPILDVLRPLDLLGLISGPVQRTLDTIGPIPIGAIQTADGVISGGTIAKLVTDKLPLGKLLSPVTDMLTGLCKVTTDVVNGAAAPIQEGGEAVGGAIEQGVGALPLPGATPGDPDTPGQPGTNPGGGGSTPGTNPGGGGGGSPSPPGVSNPVVGGGVGVGGLPLYNGLGRVPRDYYGDIPAFAPGLFSPSPAVRYGGAVPGYTPEFGILGGEGLGDGVQAAGHAEAIGAPGGNRIAFPVLLAVLVLSGVTAALVRTWVLRRTAV
ncbi:hypothetical protein [Actinokineospora fastidiosa]|uniref:Uncharacterized protein n=1 Tax=Actinokineospora fastidiosa TaxID=1816 RepID=A0A918L8C6_9PSEU|nr:hypothetical protein [Actinokineospora fastidiosa]GGS19448.1 hypothetical protein GCM10010171_10040 [Actinokineospora fastidiosa]